MMDVGTNGRGPGDGQRAARRPGLSVRGRIALLATVGGSILQVLLIGAAYIEWRIATAGLPMGTIDQGTVLQAIGLPAVGALPVLLIAGIVTVIATRLTVTPLLTLARTADEIARRGRAAVPYLGRADQVGDMADALQSWQDEAAVREAVLDRAPVGICHVDSAGRLINVNLRAEELLGFERGDLAGRSMLELVFDEDLKGALEATRELLAGSIERTEFDGRLRRADGTPLWCSMVVAPAGTAPGPAGGHADTFILIVQDVSARKLQAEQAAAFQRELLPKQAPRLRDYELAGRCLPAQDVAGDLYDWTLTGDGCLDLTVADVMGKGMGAALVMARLQSALGTAPAELGPADRVTIADRSVTFAMDESAGFVTLFHARLDLATGVLRYVDAGHGYCVLLREDGRVVRLAGTSLPLGLDMGEEFSESRVELHPGDTLLVHSDGLVEFDDRTIDERELVSELERARNASEMVDRLVDRVAARHTDDVTALVLRRLAVVNGG